MRTAIQRFEEKKGKTPEKPLQFLDHHTIRVYHAVRAWI
eukprot:COSAG05_NODE_11_length_38500_cov_831.349861_7_plen_39_part_00